MRQNLIYLTGISILLAVLCSCEKQEIQPGQLVPKTVVDNPTLPAFVLSDGTRLHLETFGQPSNPALIVLHGGPGNSYRPYLDWKVFSDQYYVIFWDQRGAGLSERVPNGELTGPRYLKDLHEIGDYFSPATKFHLLGHSWGGAFAAYYVQQHPESVDKLVLIEPGPMNEQAMRNTAAADINFFDKELQAFLNNSDYMIPGNDEAADYFRMTSKFESQTLENSDTRQGFRSNYYINNWRGLWDKSYTADFTAGVKEHFPTEVLFVAGTSERLGVDFQRRYHAAHFNLYEGDVFELDGADHFETIRSPLTIQKIREYLDQ